MIKKGPMFELPPRVQPGATDELESFRAVIMRSC
jgi:hypothetical protein